MWSRAGEWSGGRRAVCALSCSEQNFVEYLLAQIHIDEDGKSAYILLMQPKGSRERSALDAGVFWLEAVDTSQRDRLAL